MGQLENWKMTPLDAAICSNRLQILKVLVFFFPPARQKPMILLIKLLELRQCLSLSAQTLSSLSRPMAAHDAESEMFNCIFPYCDPEKQQMLRQMQNTLQIMKTVQQFSDFGMSDLFGQMMGNGDLPESGKEKNADQAKEPSSSSDQMASMLTSMLSPEQQSLFHQYESMLDQL